MTFNSKSSGNDDGIISFVAGEQLADNNNNTTATFSMSKVMNQRVQLDNEEECDEDDVDKYDFNGFYLTKLELSALQAPSSCFIFNADGWIRIRILQLVRTRWFQTAILLAIALNSLTLGIDWPANNNPPAMDFALQVLDYSFTAIFALEMILKVIAFGFVLHDGSYLRVGWNVMDMLIVLFSVVQLFFGQRALSGIRAVRVFRPLRSISRIPRLKQLVAGLIRALPQVFDNLLLFLFVMFLFAMGGVQLYLDSLSQRCYIESFPQNDSTYSNLSVPFLVQNETTFCGGALNCQSLDPSLNISESCMIHRDIFVTKDQNYDNIFSAMILVLKVIVNDNWPDDLQAALQSNGYSAVVFFTLLIVIGTWYCVNLFLAILNTSYSIKQDDEDPGKEFRYNKKDKSVQADIEAETALFEEIDRIEEKLIAAGTFTSHFGYFEYNPTQGIQENLVAQGMVALSLSRKMPKTAGGAGVFRIREGFTYLDVFQDDINTPVVPALSDVLPSEQPEEAHDNAEKENDDDGAENEQDFLKNRLDDHRWAAQKFVAEFVGHRYWDYFILCVTVVNVGALSIDYYGISDTLNQVLNVVSLTCTAFFGLDVCLKLFAFGIVAYFSLGMNRLDATLVVASIPDIIASGGGSSAFSAIRVFRLLRLLRIMKSVKSIQTLLLCVMHSLSSAALLSMLLVLVLYIYSILGMQLYGTSYNSAQSNPLVRDSFGTLWEAALACFIVVTGDNWTSRIFLDGADTVAGAIQNVVFFVSLFIIGNYVFINLFVAILLDSLSEMMEKVEETELCMPNLVLPTINNAHTILLKRRFSSRGKIASPVQNELPKDDDDENDVVEDEDVLARSNAVRGFHDKLEEEDGMLWKHLQSIALHLFGDRGIVVEGNSLNVFSPDSLVRRFVLRVVTSNFFDYLVNIVLVINVFAIGVDSPLNSQDTRAKLQKVDQALTAIFVIEMCLKIVTYGLVFPAGILKKQMVSADACEWKVHPAYLRIGWNIVDAVVVLTSILGLAFEQFKILRAFRTIRLIHRVPPMKTVVLSLLQALPQVANAVALCIFLVVVFTIMGVQFFKGKFYQCNDPLIETIDLCVGNFTAVQQDAIFAYNVTRPRVWERMPFHFDNFGASMTSVFVVAVGDGWSSIMYNAMDTTIVGGGLTWYASPWYSLYFVIMFVCCNFCALQMLVGVLINYFQEMKELNDGSAVLTPHQRMYVHARHAIDSAAIVAEELVPAPNVISEFCHSVFTYRLPPLFGGLVKLQQSAEEYVSLAVVLLNTAALAYTHSGMTDSETNISNNINTACLAVFTVEMIMMLLAYFPQQYFGVGWNILDFTIIMLGWLDFIMPSLPGLTFLRVIRVSKLLRGTGVERLIVTSLRSSQSFINALLMLILMFFIYAAIGVQLFAFVPPGNAISATYNFHNLPSAMLVLFQIITTEGWETTLTDCAPYATGATAYFITFMLIGCYTVLQMFTAVIVDAFEQQSDEADRIVADFNSIKEQWINTFGTTDSVAMSDFIPFLSKIPPSLTELSKTPRRVDVVHLLASLSIPITSHGIVKYHHIIHALAWRRFHIEVRTIGGVIHGIVFDKLIHQSFTIGEAFCAEILQTRWREYRLKKEIGARKYRELEHQSQTTGVFAMPRSRSIVHTLERRRSSVGFAADDNQNNKGNPTERKGNGVGSDDDSDHNVEMSEYLKGTSADFSGGDTAVPPRRQK